MSFLQSRQLGILGAALVVLALLATACSGSDGSTPTTPTLRPGETPLPTATATEVLDDHSPDAHPTSTPTVTNQVRFNLKAPETPDGSPVFLTIKSHVGFSTLEHLPLQHTADGWTGVLDLPEGALVHYVYDRWTDQSSIDGFVSTREGHGETMEIESRLLHVTPANAIVEDVVETWADDRQPATTGTLTGVVIDIQTGEAIVDVDVTAGGVHVATDFKGRFRIEGLAVGGQRVTAYRLLGEHMVTTALQQVSPGEATPAILIAMEPARQVSVFFDVELPPDTPPDAEVRIAGSIYQLGAYRWSRNHPLQAQDITLPALERVGDDHAHGSFQLYQGTPISYFYTLTSTFNGRERTSEGQDVWRYAEVQGNDSVIVDTVESWWDRDNQRLVTLRVDVPADTDPGAFVATVIGPAHKMARTNDYEFVTFLTGRPGEVVDYSINLGDSLVGADGTQGLGPNGQRRLVIGDAHSEERVVVERWEAGRTVTTPTPGSMIDVVVRVVLPPSTDAGEVRLVLAPDSAGSSESVMSQLLGAPYWEGSFQAPAGQPITYAIASAASSGPTRSVTPRYDGQVINDWVTTWPGAATAPGGTMPGYMTALYTPDFWSPGFQPLSEPTFEAIAKHNGGWVTVSSVWSYGTIQPLPSIESRPLVSDTVLTPRPDIVEQARKAHEAGLKVMLAPQFNMEMSPGGLDALHGDEEWWDTWLAAAEEMWRWNADVAEEIGAEALVLPGYVFHVFAPPDQFPSLDAFETFDEKLVGLVSRVRAKYSGKIVISGGVLDSDAPGLADMVGVTTYDTGAPSLANDASVDEWHVAYEALLTEKVDPIYERWSKPVLFYTINIPRAGGATAAAEADQARQLEGILRAVADRPWIAGSFMWSYRMVDAPTSADDGLRGRLGEAVMARYYELFAGAK